MTSQSEHLRTDHLVQDIKARAVSGGIDTAAGQVAKLIVTVGGAVVLARLLGPNEYGLIGMVLAVTNLLGMFKELGLSTATVQREDVTQQQVSNLFWINFGLGAAVAVMGVATSPLLAWFYRDSRLIPIMAVLSLGFLLSGSSVQHQALLTRQMRFRALAVVDVSSVLTGFVVAFACAKAGWSYWALVAQQLTTAMLTVILIWSLSRWRPEPPRRKSGVMPFLRFGAHLTLAEFVGRMSVATDSILIGRFYGAEALGLYSRGNALLARPLEQVVAPTNAVVVPVLSRLQFDPERYRRSFLRAFESLALLTFPFSALCLALSEPLVLVLLGQRWQAATPFFAGFALLAISQPLSITPSWLLMSQGRGRDLLKIYTITGAVTIASYVIGLTWGPLGVVLAVAAASMFVRLPVIYYMAGRSGPVSTKDLWKSFVWHMPCWAGVFAGATLAQGLAENLAPIVQLLICVPFGIISGITAAFLFKHTRLSLLYAIGTAKGVLDRAQAKATITSASAGYRFSWIRLASPPVGSGHDNTEELH